MTNLCYSPPLKSIDSHNIASTIGVFSQSLMKGGEKVKMNKKLLGFALAFTFLAMLAGPVMAGKGQPKLSFEFVLVGETAVPPIPRVVETGNTTHYFGLAFVNTMDLVLKIDNVAIPPEYLTYEGLMHVNVSPKGGTVYVDEIITIASGAPLGAGEIILRVQGNPNRGQGQGAGVNFIGFGTGAYEGIKISGTSVGPVDEGDYSKLTRTGIVMGWP